MSLTSFQDGPGTSTCEAPVILFVKAERAGMGKGQSAGVHAGLDSDPGELYRKISQLDLARQLDHSRPCLNTL